MPKYFIITIVVFLLFSCDIILNERVDDDADFHQIKIDEIVGPDTVIVGEEITFYLDGFVGPNGCYSFSHFDKQEFLTKSELSVWAIERKHGNCTTATVYLKNKEYSVIAKQNGIFELVIKQPSGTTKSCSVIVQSLDFE